MIWAGERQFQGNIQLVVEMKEPKMTSWNDQQFCSYIRTMFFRRQFPRRKNVDCGGKRCREIKYSGLKLSCSLITYRYGFLSLHCSPPPSITLLVPISVGILMTLQV